MIATNLFEQGRGSRRANWRVESVIRLSFRTAVRLHKMWGGRPRPRPAPDQSWAAREVLPFKVAGRSRGTRADQGVCPTAVPQDPRPGKLNGNGLRARQMPGACDTA